MDIFFLKVCHRPSGSFIFRANIVSLTFKSNVQSSLTRIDVYVIYNKKKGMF